MWIVSVFKMFVNRVDCWDILWGCYKLFILELKLLDSIYFL